MAVVVVVMAVVLVVVVVVVDSSSGTSSRSCRSTARFCKSTGNQENFNFCFLESSEIFDKLKFRFMELKRFFPNLFKKHEFLKFSSFRELVAYVARRATLERRMGKRPEAKHLEPKEEARAP